MIDRIDKGSEQDGKDTALSAANEAAQADAKLETRPMSKGEIWYNRIVYKVLNYWVNLGISLVITDVFAHGRGKGFFTNGVNRIATGLTSTGLMKNKTATRFGEVLLGTFTLNSGGNLMVIPTKIAEDNKRPIVHLLNKKFFKEKQLAPDGHEETPDEIYIAEEQPKQSWGNIIKRRAMGFGATTAVGMVLDKALAKKRDVPIMMNGELSTHINGQQRYTDATVKAASYVLNSGVIPGGKALAANDGVKRYMGYAALDWIYTIITSKIMHVTNGAKKARMPHEIGDDFDPPGIAVTDDILIEPATHAGTKTPLANKQLRVDDKHPDLYKKKKPVLSENHMALAGKSDPSSLPAF